MRPGRADPAVLKSADPAWRTRHHDRERRSAIVSCSASSSDAALIPNASVAALESSTNGFRNWYWVSRDARASGLNRPPSHNTG